jgi:hypothetical protein
MPSVLQQSDTMPDPSLIRRPPFGFLFLEGRAVLELAALVPAYPRLRQAPRGDGHPVLVLPAFMTTDVSTRLLRGFLRDRGYAAHGWKLGRNTGPSPDTVTGLARRLDELRSRYGRRVSVIGWSLGGVYARELARAFPADVRQVIALASPFRNLEAVNVPAFLLKLRPRHPDEAALQARLREPVPVPMTAIYSRTDGVASWQSCLAESGPLSESIEVDSSHLGISWHPAVLLTIADRLAQPDGAWSRFRTLGGWPFAARATAAPSAGGTQAGQPSVDDRGRAAVAGRHG